MNLPVEVSLQVLGSLDRQTLGQIMVANRRLAGIVNRNRKALKLPEIPVPLKLSVRLKLLALLAAAMLLLLPIGIACAQYSTRSRLRAAGLVPESFHDVQQFQRDDVPVASCTTTCDSPLQCHARCDFQYTILDQSKGRVTKQNCSSTGLLTTNASIGTPVGWTCSFDYMVDEAGVDIEVSKMTFQWHWVTWTGLFLAVLDLVVAALLLREDRWIADDYMFAAQYRVRYRKNEKYRKAFIDRDRRMHDKLRKTLIGAIAAAFIFTGLYASVAL
ncbi:hypothetical protein AAVH_30152, partial [Aphelenchoides avenae]